MVLLDLRTKTCERCLLSSKDLLLSVGWCYQRSVLTRRAGGTEHVLILSGSVSLVDEWVTTRKARQRLQLKEEIFFQPEFLTSLRWVLAAGFSATSDTISSYNIYYWILTKIESNLGNTTGTQISANQSFGKSRLHHHVASSSPCWSRPWAAPPVIVLSPKRSAKVFHLALRAEYV